MLSIAAKKRRTDAAAGPMYDSLVACDVVSYLLNHVPPGGADLIVAADVLVYMRELESLISAAATSLAPSGLFAFSTERAMPGEVACPPDGNGWLERPSERMAHLESYVRYLVDATDGLEIVTLDATIIRNDESAPIWGQICVVRKVAL